MFKFSRVRMKLYINSLFIGLVSFIWANVYWLGDSNLWQVQKIVSLDLNRPWVYRQLVPFLTRTLSLTGMRIDWALVLVVTLSGVSFYLALRKLWFTLSRYDERDEIYLALIVFVGLLLLGYNRLPYDLTTAFLFTLAYLFIYTDNKLGYLVVFTLACFNRETAFLLILLYVVVSLAKLQFIKDWWMTVCQIYIYLLVTYCLRLAFQYNDGVTLWVEPRQNLVRFMNNPLLTLVHLSVTGVILWLGFRDWKYKSPYLRVAFWVVAPVLLVMYIVCGQNYEVRTLWEVWPIAGLLCIPKVKL